VWTEAIQRGQKWRQLIHEGMSQLAPQSRDLTLKAVDERRSLLSGLDLTFNNPPPKYDFSRDVVTFSGQALGNPVQCAISREALDHHFGADGLDQKARIEKFFENRSTIERMARTKYLSWPIEAPGQVLIRTIEVPRLLKEPAKATS
jgi:hypothetical protein